MKITSQELSAWSDYINGLCGISLDQTKDYLIESRLDDMIKELNMRSFSELLARVKADLSGKMQSQVIERITTRETSFFRDSSPFDLLRNKIIPELIDRAEQRGLKTIPIRIWSAACSSGQELYSAAIVLTELLGNNPRYNLRLIGTDISKDAVAEASKGEYQSFHLDRGLPASKRTRFFEQHNKMWKIKDEIRAMVAFRNLNLLKDFSTLGKFDIIFCRNVAIYFTDETKRDLFNRIYHSLDQDGVLIVGSSESISGYCPQLKSQRHLRSVYYQK